MSDTRFVLIVFVIAMLGPFASDSYLPSLPQMTEYFGTTANMMQFSITAYFLGLSVLQLFWGPLSDKMGRKHALQLGCITALFGCAICIFAPSPTVLLIGRFIQGAGGAANASLFRAIMRDRFSGKRLAEMSSYVGVFFAVVPSIAPMVGGFVQSAFSWQANFVLLFLLTLFVLFFITKFFEESNKALNQRALHLDQFIQNYKTLLTHKPFLGYIAASCAGFSGIIAYYIVSPFLLQTELGLTPFEYGMSAIFITGGLMMGQLLNTFLINRLGIHKMLLISFSLMLTSGIVMLTLSMMGIFNVAAICVPTLIFIMGSGLAFSNASAGAFQSFGHIAGAAGAMFGCLQIMGTTVVSFVVSMFHDTDGSVLAYTYITLAILGYTGYTLLVQPHKNRIEY